jgi:hypothetical protein
MHYLVADPNSRVRLIAAGSVLAEESSDSTAGDVLVDALGDPALRLREAAMDLFESLGNGGTAILEGLKQRDGKKGGPGMAGSS